MTTPIRSLRLVKKQASTLDGFAYEPGEIFWDVTNDTLRVYDGVVTGGYILASRDWVDAQLNDFVTEIPIASTTVLGGVKVDGVTIVADPAGVITAVGAGGSGGSNISMTRFQYTITVLTSELTGPDDNANTLAYELDNINVYLNGQRLKYGIDYTATDGVAITLTTPIDTGFFEIDTWTESSVFPTDAAGALYNDGLGNITWTQLSDVALTGAYGDLIGAPGAYTLPVATISSLGGVRVDGSTIIIDGTGTITAVAGGGGGSSTAFGTIGVSGQGSVVADSSNDTLTFVAGSGISITTDPVTDSVTIASTVVPATTNSFANIAVSGQGTVVADSDSDTLTLIAGANITITTSTINDSITISATGGGGGGTTYDQSLNTTDDVEFASVTAATLTSTGVGTPTYTSGADFIFNTGSSAGSVVVNGAVEATKFLTLTPLGSAPSGATVGTFAVANRTGWDPALKGSGPAYPVFYNGTAWTALY